MDPITLTNVFESHKEALSEKLKGLSLPHDARKVQEIVADFLNSLFESDGIYRQNLNQSEDYILQSALQLLQAQQNISAEVISAVKTTNQVQSTPVYANAKRGNKYTPILGAGAGAIAGSLIGSWGAVCGAIAGTALVLYISDNTRTKNGKLHTNNETTKTAINVPIEKTPLNIGAFMSIIKEVCISIDAIISTYRTQISRVVNKYESQTRPSIEVEHQSLLECIQSVIGYVECHSLEEPNFTKKLNQRIEDLREILDSYGIDVVAYDGENGRFFDEVESKQVMEVKMTVPALVKDLKAVLKGKILIPAKQL